MNIKIKNYSKIALDMWLYLTNEIQSQKIIGLLLLRLQ